jgi:hypothetical protein
VGALRSLTNDKPYQRTAIWIGVGLGLLIQAIRLKLFALPAYQRWRQQNTGTRTADFVIDAVLLPSPYAYSFGTFLGLATSTWFAVGGVIASVSDTIKERRGAKPEDDALPSDMSTISLLGGGLIAGDALAALGLGVAGLLGTLLG